MTVRNETPADSVKVLYPGDPEPPPGALTCALVNNMPDSALLATELQFRRLLDAGASESPLYVRMYSFPGIERGDACLARIAGNYFPIDHLWDSAPAVLAITGSEPRTTELTEEPYWDDMVRTLDEGIRRCDTILLSCLAAHAALLHLDGLSRVRLDAKCSGIFAQAVSTDSPLAVGLPPRLVMPHSRLNEVAPDALRRAGYELISTSEIGWGVASATKGDCLVVAFQGHPEYDADTLLREYRRDVGRFLDGERSAWPLAPDGYLDAPDLDLVDDFRASVEPGDPDAMDRFPFEAISAHLGAAWQEPTARLCRNWIAEVRRRRSDLTVG